MVLFTPKKLTFKGSKKQHQILAQTAYYQAGKIVVQTILPEQPPIALITLNTLGTTCSTSADTYIPIENIFNTQSCFFLESRLVSLYGGKAASLLIEYQQRFANGVSTTSPQPTSDSSISVAPASQAQRGMRKPQRGIRSAVALLPQLHLNELARRVFSAKQRRGIRKPLAKFVPQRMTDYPYGVQFSQVHFSGRQTSAAAVPQRGMRQTSAALPQRGLRTEDLRTGVKEDALLYNKAIDLKGKTRLVRTCFAAAGNNIFQSTLGNIEIQAATRLAKIMVNYWNFYSLNKNKTTSKSNFSTEAKSFDFIASINSINRLANLTTSSMTTSFSNASVAQLRKPYSEGFNASLVRFSGALRFPQYLYKPGLLYKSEKSKSQAKKGLTLLTSVGEPRSNDSVIVPLRGKGKEGENSATMCNSWLNKEGLAQLKDHKQKENGRYATHQQMKSNDLSSEVRKIEDLKGDLQRERKSKILSLQLSKPSLTRRANYSTKMNPKDKSFDFIVADFSGTALQSSATLVEESIIPFTGDSERYAKRKYNIRVWGIKLKVKDKTPQGHVVYRIQNNLYFAIAQSKNSLKICKNKNSSYNIQRLSIENIGNYSQLNNNNFQLINSLQFSNLQRDRFYTNWFRLYLPDMEATEFFKNVANYYFSLGLQTLTFPSTKSSYYFIEGKLGVSTANPFLTFLNKTTSNSSVVAHLQRGVRKPLAKFVPQRMTDYPYGVQFSLGMHQTQKAICTEEKYKLFLPTNPSEVHFSGGSSTYNYFCNSLTQLHSSTSDIKDVKALANLFQPRSLEGASGHSNPLNVPFSLLLENQIFPLNYNGFLIVEKELLYNALVNSCFAKAFYLINQNRQLVDFLVDYLLRFQILRQHQILYLFSTLLLGCNKTA